MRLTEPQRALLKRAVDRRHNDGARLRGPGDHRTAYALQKRGLVRIDLHGPTWGSRAHATDEGLRVHATGHDASGTPSCRAAKRCCACDGPLVAGEGVGIAVFRRPNGAEHNICGHCRVPKKSDDCVNRARRGGRGEA